MIPPQARIGLSIPEAFRALAAELAQDTCIRDDRGGLSYGALDRRSDRLAAGLAATGAREGDRIGLLCPNGAEFAVAYLGILKCGATVVPLNLFLSATEMRYCLGDSGARGLVHHAAFDRPAAESTLGLDLPSSLRIGDGPPDPGPEPSEPAVAPRLGLGPGEAVAVILYTSGTTGRPKGAMLTHKNLVSNAESVARALGVCAEDRVLVVLPMFHAFAATVGLLTPLLHGSALIPLPRFEPRAISQAIADHGATLFLGVPSMYSVLLRLDERSVAQWSGVRLCVSGGAALPAATLAAFESRFGVPVVEGDGPTECGPVTCVNPPQGPRKPGSVGLPIPGVEMRILDPDGRELPDDTPGEVCVRGPSVMKGYHGLPEATSAAFFGDWFRTGDLGTRDGDGYFFLVDRIKDLIIVNGMNVYPRVIEEVLYAHPKIAEAAVVGDPDPRHGEVPVAYVAARPGETLEATEVRDWCRGRLGRHEQPRRVLIRDALPKNAAGKILKRELRRTGETERGIAAATQAQPGPVDR
jgi:long-chain acyl-CoA synthetase